MTEEVKSTAILTPETCGVLNINKPAGITSHDVVDAVRKILRIRKVGHTGTLDPQATGVLPICVGRATKISQFLLAADKEYQIIMRLGVATDTQDASGKVIEEGPYQEITREYFLTVLERFTGEIEQIPPMFSAKKQGGVRLYQLARKGEEVAREARQVRILALDLLDFQPPLVTLRVHCSKGTYARALCHDMGKELGCGAHLYQLCRLRTGNFALGQAITLENLKEAVAAGSLEAVLVPIQEALSHMPEVLINPRSGRKIANGAAIPAGVVVSYPDGVMADTLVRVLGYKRKLLSVAKTLQSSEEFRSMKPGLIALKPVRVIKD